ncbi:MAG: shikimate dehydrogenase [Bacillati bacterium ANGP1]|uniref:Shikimate dehydrogenase (NADP(+)) n=1 Tax=Candidatus Segetimicrobium genomatis TaxID=2569760 RepID=A0A537L1G3_9BACT|nr:MAG: shikimate dehydrogenase [Terrabacteria group bacterium ANGP1]
MVEIDAQTTLVGIIGDPVAHSLSPRMHNAAFNALQMNWRYAAFRVPAAGLSQALRGIVGLGMAGVNVTIPHKESAAGVLDELDDLARQIGAVKGMLDALTSDGGMPAAGRRCVVVGAGGGGRAAAFALAAAGASRVTVLNRTERKAQSLADAVRRAAPGCRVEPAPLLAEAVERAVADAEIVVHATAATMSAAMGGGGGRADWLQVLARRLHRGMAVLDMVYTPAWTELLGAAKAAGATAVSGLSMLVFQGARSFQLWTGRQAPLDVMRRAVGLNELPLKR